MALKMPLNSCKKEVRMMNEQPLIECKNLTKSYTTGTEALSHVSLTVGRGKIVGLLGPNGSGKTTLIKLLSGLLTPTQGDVCIDGHAPGIYTKSIVSYLPDRMYFPKWMRVNDILAFFADFYPDFDRKKALDMLSSLGIAPGEKIRRLSKGTQEKVQLVLAMSRRAKLYLLDEPIGGVDPAARDFIIDTIMANYAPDAAVVISTHLISDVERILDNVVFIDRGHVAMAGEADELRSRSGKSINDLFREVFRC